MQDWIQIQAEPIDAARAIQFVTDPQAGGISVFLGTTRSQTSPDGLKLVALDYDAYLEMATQQMLNLGRQAREKWPLRRVVILHRTGRVLLAEPSVIIAVSAPHRAEAFEACRWIIDTLKSEVAIWKREIWEGGEGRWVHPGE
jgi:molybdopterin synthase catalytic subunit